MKTYNRQKRKRTGKLLLNFVEILTSVIRRAIEQEKAVYKESFENLRVLKPEIEHIRKVCNLLVVKDSLHAVIYIADIGELPSKAAISI
jgi:hypothetical protein